MRLMKTEIDRLGFLIHDSARLIRKRFEREASDFGLSAAQWRALFRIMRSDGRLAQARLAELLEIEPISVSRLLDRMEEGGWIERHFDPTDRRVRNVMPTDKARDVFGRVRVIALGVYEDALSGLDEPGRQALITGLETIAANLAEPETDLGLVPLKKAAGQ